MRLAIACLALLAVAATSPNGCGKEPYQPCAGKRCGESCAECAPDDHDCAETAVVKACDAAGTCTAVGTFTCAPPDPCAGKSCGDSCNPCGDADPCPTFAATACDRDGRCVTATPSLCYDACAGKKCGEACSICPPDAGDCAMIMCLTSCDGAGRCTCSGGGAACP